MPIGRVPTEFKKELLEMWEEGYNKGYEIGVSVGKMGVRLSREGYEGPKFRKPKRKLSAWNKFVKANSKKPRFKYRDGKLNLKKLGVAFRKTPAGKKKRR